MDGFAEVTYMQNISGNTGAAYNISGNVVVPDSIEYDGQKIPVAKIGNKAFYRTNSIVTVSLPATITEIGAEAFYRCTAITMISLPESLRHIGNSAFEGCTSLTTIEMGDSVKTIGSSAFYLCTSLTSLTLPHSVTAIGASAFSRCANLTTLALPEGLTTIESGLFYNCTSLTEVILPDSLCTIKSNAFYACTSMASIFIPATVTSIGEDAFRGCINAESVIVDGNNTVFDSRESCNAIIESGSNTMVFAGRNAFIPDGIKTIGMNSFNTSYRIYEASIYSTSYSNYSPLVFDIIYIPTSVTLIYANAFSQVRALHFASVTPPILNGTLSQVMLHVPCGASTMYINYYGTWSSYVKEYGPDISFEATSSDPMRGSCIVLEGDTYGNLVTCDSAATVEAVENYGYVFSHWSDGNYDSIRTLHLVGDSSITAYFSKQDFYISGLVEESDMGYVVGNGYVSYLDTATLVAVANPGYHFDRWYTVIQGRNGAFNITESFDDTLRVVVTGAQAYYAGFLPDVYTVTLVSDSSAGAGHCSGGGEYEYPTTVDISSTPDYGYRFSHWNDGDTSNPRTITLTQDTMFTAYYTKDTFTVHIHYDTSCGTVIGDTVVAYGDTLTLVAEPEYGYHFGKWTWVQVPTAQGYVINESYDSILHIRVNGSINVVADFDNNLYMLAIEANVVGRGLSDTLYDSYLTEEWIEAVPNYGYHFSHWSDGDTNNPRPVVVAGDTAFMAVYEPNQYTLTLTSANTELGTVEGAGIYNFGDTVEITAIPAVHYHLDYWRNTGSYCQYYNNPLSIAITGDLTLQAYFAVNSYTVSAQSNDVQRGTVSGGGTYPYPSTTTLVATPYSGYRFSHWSDGLLDNPYTLAVTADTSITAVFIATGERYQDTVTVYDTLVVHDTVEYNIEYRDSVQYNIVVVDSTVYNIIQSDSIVYYYDTMCVTHDTVFITVHDTIVITVHDTVYLTDPAGIESQSALVISIGVDGHSIIVGGAENRTVQLYDAVGRLVATRRSLYDRVVFEAPTSGSYVVLVDGVAARKAVVVR